MLLGAWRLECGEIVQGVVGVMGMKTSCCGEGNCKSRVKDIILHIGTNGKTTSTAFFWVITERVVVSSYRRFG
jgi:hypothetical protein